ncbi:monooxygenase [Metarhizium acridum]|uniref:monooxygenase n=1 Tax=Metarhizium acridum TaxID=92637 RepID=UPI001C6D1220|nr:monooxygenase [Metarhizium acridum]
MGTGGISQLAVNCQQLIGNWQTSSLSLGGLRRWGDGLIARAEHAFRTIHKQSAFNVTSAPLSNGGMTTLIYSVRLEESHQSSADGFGIDTPLLLLSTGCCSLSSHQHHSPLPHLDTMGSIYPSTFNVKRIAVIGAGPCGLAAAKYLRAQGTYDRIVVFEQQAEVGGVWNYDTVVPAPNPIPQTSPFYPPDEPARVPHEKFPIFPSPMYSKLHANIPKSLMMFSDLEFPQESWIYPSRHDIQHYLVKYAQDVRDLIKFCFQVKRVLLQPENGRDKWQVTAQSTVDGQVFEDVFDAVVVANGHYSTPFVPDIKNIRDFHRTHPSIIIHSKNYHSMDTFRDKKTVIVGNGPSGLDIAYQINSVSKGQTILSVRHETRPEFLQHTGCREIGEDRRVSG